MSRPLVIDVVDGTDGVPAIQIRSGNGKIMFASEGYDGGVAKANKAIDVIISKISDGEYVVKRNGVLEG